MEVFGPAAPVHAAAPATAPAATAALHPHYGMYPAVDSLGAGAAVVFSSCSGHGSGLGLGKNRTPAGPRPASNDGHTVTAFFGLVCCALGLWGCTLGCTSPALEAVFADSIGTGHRNKAYTRRWVVQQSARAFGPLLAVVLFVALGDHWRIEELRLVITSGTLLAVVAAGILVFAFDDDNALGAQSEAHSGKRASGSVSRKSKQKKKRGVGTSASSSSFAKQRKKPSGSSSWWRKKSQQLQPIAHIYEDDDSDDSLLGAGGGASSSTPAPMSATPSRLPRGEGEDEDYAGGSGGADDIYAADRSCTEDASNDAAGAADGAAAGAGAGGPHWCMAHSFLVPLLLAISSGITGTHTRTRTHTHARTRAPAYMLNQLCTTFGWQHLLLAVAVTVVSRCASMRTRCWQ